ncbi:unnamed protein product [Prorocentrum cordatum]|uniref:Uncharacterized protein n=1 Tax=Prorocentrum cordatum TaxID=2364126 RepID=A0ABN9W9H3_9DINO|nr:unnamed protein product [Polarella glacialis]
MQRVVEVSASAVSQTRCFIDYECQLPHILEARASSGVSQFFGQSGLEAGPDSRLYVRGAAVIEDEDVPPISSQPVAHVLTGDGVLLPDTDMEEIVQFAGASQRVHIAVDCSSTMPTLCFPAGSVQCGPLLAFASQNM